MEIALKTVISQNLQAIRVSNGLEVSMMADFLGISFSRLESYLYARNIPSLDTLIHICDYFNYPINDFLETQILTETEQNFLLQIDTCFQSLSEWNQHQLIQILQPIVDAMVEGVPHLQNTGFGQRIRILREDKNISSKSIAKSCDITIDSLKGLESSQRLPGMITFIKLCNTLSVSPAYLLNDQSLHSRYHSFDVYSLTPRQIESIAVTSCQICHILHNA